MGFLKRLFSIGSKKHKKDRLQIVHNVDAKLRAVEEEEHEAAMGRILRSSSTRYTVVNEVEYSSLPPLPHPINAVIQPPSSSAISLASSTISQHIKYNVTIHKRKQHSLTEFSDTNTGLANDVVPPPEPSPLQPKDASGLLELRSNPSIASLLSLYDEYGHLPDQAFSNDTPSPKKAERPQAQRNGSTLRQLLGDPPSLNSKKSVNIAGSLEGDISWAERFLGENESVISSVSSVEPHTPATPHDHYDNGSRHDLSMSTYENPAISSMEVELSISESHSHIGAGSEGNPYLNSDSTTPQRASQVFRFLTHGKQVEYLNEQERSLPELPSVFSVSSNETSLDDSKEPHSHFSDDSFDNKSAPSAPNAIQLDNNFRITGDLQSSVAHPESPSDTSYPPASEVTDRPAPNVAETLWEPRNSRKMENIVNIPKRVIVTAPTPSGKSDAPSRIPHGPRAPSKRLSTGSRRVRRASTISEWSSNPVAPASSSSDPYTSIVAKRRSHRRTPSNDSSSSRSRKAEISRPIRLMDKTHRRQSESRSILDEMDKENGTTELTVKPILPSTPLRYKSDSKSLFRAAVTPAMFRPPAGMTPSPASSSELSPVGKQMMINIRQQRSKTRSLERQRSAGRFGFSAPMKT